MFKNFHPISSLSPAGTRVMSFGALYNKKSSQNNGSVCGRSRRLRRAVMPSTESLKHFAHCSQFRSGRTGLSADAGSSSILRAPPVSRAHGRDKAPYAKESSLATAVYLGFWPVACSCTSLTATSWLVDVLGRGRISVRAVLAFPSARAAAEAGWASTAPASAEISSVFS